MTGLVRSKELFYLLKVKLIVVTIYSQSVHNRYFTNSYYQLRGKVPFLRDHCKGEASIFKTVVKLLLAENIFLTSVKKIGICEIFEKKLSFKLTLRHL